MDDPFVSCPYDPVHRVPRSRIQAHIVKCEEKYPPLAICPYNATHRMSEEALKEHVRNCPTKELNFPTNPKPKQIGAATTKPLLKQSFFPGTDPNNEMWDD